MNTQLLAETIIARNFRLRVNAGFVPKIGEHKPNDLFEMFVRGPAWPNQIAHLKEQLDTMSPEALEKIMKEHI